MFCPKSILIFLQILPLPKEMSQSLCPSISIEALYWLFWMSVSSERAILIARYLDPIVIVDDEICSTLVQFMFYAWSVVYYWVLYFSNQSGQWWFYYIVNVIFVKYVNVRRMYINLILCNFLLFTRNFSIWYFEVSFCLLAIFQLDYSCFTHYSY